MADARELAQWAFIAGVAGGAVALAGTLMTTFMMIFMAGMGGMGGGMMGGRFGGSEVFFLGAFLFSWLAGLAAGVLGIVGGLRVRRDPANAAMWGTILIIAGAVAFLSAAGSLGGIGILIAGVLAHVAAKESQRQPGAVAESPPAP